MKKKTIFMLVLLILLIGIGFYFALPKIQIEESHNLNGYGISKYQISPTATIEEKYLVDEYGKHKIISKKLENGKL